MTYIVDTHALVWFLERNSKLPETARIALLDPNAQIILPTIVLTEITFLYSKKRIAIDFPTVLSEVASSSNCTVYPLDEEVVLRIPTNLNFHDAIIVATGLLFKELMGYEAAIITKDKSIKNSDLIKTV